MPATPWSPGPVPYSLYMDQPSHTSLISLNGVRKSYKMDSGDVHALRGVSFELLTGEFCVLMGISGSGKSTLLNVMGCLDRPTSGRYSLFGTDVSTLAPDELAAIRNARIGFVFQSFNLLARATALENVELPLLCGANSRWISQRARERALHCLSIVGLADRAAHFPNQLSGGQQQRVAIARALVNEPQIIFADEPTGNLDSITSLEILALFQELNRSGITIVMVTHEFENSLFGSRRIVLRDGLVIKDEPLLDQFSAVDKLSEAKALEFVNLT